MELQKLFFIRLITSVFWTTLLHVFPVTLYLLVTNFDIVHPIQCMRETLLKVLTVGNWFYLSPICGAVFFLGYVQFQEFMTPPVFSASRFQALCNLFNKNNVLKGSIYLMLGFLLPVLYLGLNDNSLSKKCEDFSKHSCLNESSVFLISSGVWTALYYFLRFDICAEKHLQFPIIQQLKFLQIRSQIFPVLKQSLKQSTVPVFYFLPFYYWNGNGILYLFKVLFKLKNGTSTLTTVSGLFNISIFIHAWLISGAFFMVINMLQLMMQIHFTEHHSFQLIKQPNSDLMLLSTALGQGNKPLVQYLGYYDLFIIATSQTSNRWQIFTLSQPGGHPHTWNALLQECLKLMNIFIGEIENIYKVPEPKRSPPPIPRHIHVHEFSPRGMDMTSGPTPLSPGCRLRNLVAPQPRMHVVESKTRFDLLREKINDHISEIYKNPGINYIFGEIPDAKIRFLVSNAQPIIWATQSLAELSAKALVEDKFGIVLKDLPIIISTLLQVKNSLDKLGNIQKKFQKLDHDICMKTALKSAVKRSLYKISIEYSDYLTDLPLSQENFQCMQNFVNFKEC